MQGHLWSLGKQVDPQPPPDLQDAATFTRIT